MRAIIRLGSADSAVSDGNSKSDANNEQEEVASSGVSSPKRGLLWSLDWNAFARAAEGDSRMGMIVGNISRRDDGYEDMTVKG